MLPGREATSRTLARLGTSGVMLFTCITLAACESSVRQDTFLVRGSTSTVLLPADSVLKSFAPRGGKAPDSQVAYIEPATPSFSDRPLDENINGSIELADYAAGLKSTGLIKFIQRAGPYTVFAVPNDPMEKFASSLPGGNALAPSARPVLNRTLGYTIVRGNWTEARVRKAISKSKTRAIGLKSISGDMLNVWLDPATHEIILGNRSGQTNRLMLSNITQSNGTLYITRSMLAPG